MNFGINVNASSSTSYSSWSPYMFFHESDKNAVSGLAELNSPLLYHRYINIPLRVANYCNNFPGNNNGECPDTFKSPIGMVGLGNGSFNNVNPSSYYSTSLNYVALQFRNASTGKYEYSSTSSGATSLKKGYFNFNNDFDEYDQTHKQPIYYVDSTHSTYMNRFRLTSSINPSNIPRTTNSLNEPGFSPGNVLMYKMSYMIGPSNGGYGDGTWSNTTPSYDPDGCPGCYTGIMPDVYDAIRKNVNMWFQDSSNYDNYNYILKSWHMQNNKFGSMFDSMTSIPGCYDDYVCQGTNTFQGSSPMLQFLSLHEHTYYDKSTNSKYTKKTTLPNGFNGDPSIEWLSSANHGLVSLMKNGNLVSHLSTSTVINAQPYNWIYDDNGTKYYATVWMLDFYFFAYIDNIYDFDEIVVRFFLDNTLSTYGNIKQLDLIKPETQVMIIGSGSLSEQLYTDLQTGIINTISNIPIIGPIIAIILEILIFCFSFIFSFITLLSDLPGWLRGALIVLFISIVAKIIYKLIRGG